MNKDIDIQLIKTLLGDFDNEVLNDAEWIQFGSSNTTNDVVLLNLFNKYAVPIYEKIQTVRQKQAVTTLDYLISISNDDFQNHFEDFITPFDPIKNHIRFISLLKTSLQNKKAKDVFIENNENANIVDHLKNLLIQKNLINENDVAGIPYTRLGFIEKQFSIKLPKAYKDYLLIFGKNAGELFDDKSICFPNILDFKKEFDNFVIHEKINYKLPENAFVFYKPNNVLFYYFICDGISDPIVYSFDVVDGENISYSHFTQFLKLSIFDLFFYKNESSS